MENIIKKIIENKLLLKLENGKLKVYKKDAGSISPELLEEIRNNKSALEDYLLSQEKNAFSNDLKLNIPKLEAHENYELSSSQRRLWILNHFEKGAVAYNIPSNFELNGNYNIDNFKKAINALIERHEILRTIFKKDEKGEIRQWVLPLKDINFSVDYLDLSQDQNGAALAKSYIESDEYKPFDLEKGPLFRVSIYKLSDEKFILYFNIHHIIGDAWSMEILFRDTFALYESYQKETAHSLPKLRIHYKDYAAWQQEQIRNGAFEKHKEFWKNKFAGDLPLLDLPSEKIRPKTKTYNGYKLGAYVSAETTMKLESYCKANAGSLYIGLVALWKTLFYKYAGQNDIVIGAPIAGRNHLDLDDQVGFFINTLPIRDAINPSASFDELFDQIKVNILESFNFQQYPFDLLTEDLNLLRNPSRSAIFDVIIGLPETQANAEDFVVDPSKIDRIFDLGKIVSKVDLAIIFSKVGNHLFFDINFNTDVYEREMIEKLIAHFKQLAAQILDKPSQTLKAIDYLSETERSALLDIYASNSFEESGVTILDLFAKSAALKPDTIAYSFGSQKITYQELDVQSDRLGYYLRKTYNLKSNDLVGILMDTNEWSVLCLLGILKSGAGYVFIDKELPEERKAYIIEDASIKALIILSDDLFDVISFTVPVFSIDVQHSDFMDLELDSESTTSVSGSDTAYVIYTSGTTGKPKGVMVSHSNVVDYYQGLEHTLSLSRFSRFGLMSSLSADLGKTVVYGSLLSGGTLYGFSKQTLMDAESLKTRIEKESIDCIKIVPSHWKALSGPDHLLLPASMIIFGGEVLSLDILDRLRDQQSHIEIVNHYGPTETTIGKLLHRVSLDNSYVQVPVGKPFSSTSVYIVNEDLGLCPLGVSGELLIGGLGVAKGYVNHPELTAKHFIANPFGEGALYKTGDKVRMRPDGEIIFLGRIDDQVKIRGYRVEPHEIASTILSYDFVDQSIVLADEDNNGYKRLVCYLVPGSGYSEEGLKSFLQSRLPDYMVPGIYIELDQMPLTSNGKIDRKSLPSPKGYESNQDYEAPQNELETDLCEIWSSLLNVERVGINDDFFALGGDSIIVIQFVSRAKRKGYHFKVQDLFDYKTISGLTIALENQSKNKIIPEQGILEGTLPLTPIQKWFFEEQNEHMSHFNMNLFFKTNKQINEGHLKKALKILTERHDTLRLKFEQDGSIYVQSYTDNSGYFESIDLTEEVESGIKNKISEICENAQNNKAIVSGDVTQFIFIKTPVFEEYNRLFISLHHLGVDGVSLRIILDELEVILDALVQNVNVELGLKTSSYRDWGNLLHTYANSEKATDQKEYWTQVKEKYIPFSTDYDAPSQNRDTLQVHVVNISEEHTTLLLKSANKAYNTEINDLLLAGLTKTISEWTGKPDVIVGLEMHGRELFSEDIDITNTTGWFTNKYPLLLQADFETEGELIKSVKEKIRNVPDKGLGYGALKYLNTDSEINGLLAGKSWDLVFNYLGQMDNVINKSNWFLGADENTGVHINKNYPIRDKLVVKGAIVNNILGFSFDYSNKQYEQKTIENLAQQFVKNLTGLIDHSVNKEVTDFTPSDFNLQEKISIEELDSLFENNDVETEGVIKF